MIPDLLFRLRVLFQRRSMDAELDEELRFHFEQEVEKLRRAGLSLEQAQREARLYFGAEPTREECRKARGSGWLEDTWWDLRYAARVLRRSPGFTLVAVLSLAVGIGANTALFTVVNAAVLRRLPVPDPQDLVIACSRDTPKRLWRRNPYTRKDASTGQNLSNTFPVAAYRQFRTRAADMLDVFAFYEGARALVGGSHPVRLTLVSDNFFQALRVPLERGRGLVPGDERAVVITEGFWRRVLGADPAIVGSTLNLNGVNVQVVGVTRPGFSNVGPYGPCDLFGPLDALDTLVPAEFPASDKPRTATDYWWLQVMARRRPGASVEAAAVRLTSLFQGVLADAGLQAKTIVRLLPGDKGAGSFFYKKAQTVGILFAVVGLVLLLACVNVATLQLAHSAARRKEIGVRISLGAGRGRIVRQLLTESLVLSLMGGLGGAFLAYAGAPLAVRLLEVKAEPFPDLRVFGFTLLVSVLCGVLFGLKPALQAAGDSGIRKPRGFGGALIAAQVALSLVLLAGAGLFVRSLLNLENVDGRFRRDHILTFSMDLGHVRIPREQIAPVYDGILEAVRATPGVLSVANASQPPIGRGTGSTYLASAGTAWQPVSIFTNTVTPEFFETMGMPILAGRPFTSRDTASAPKVAILNQSAARRFFGSGPALGEIVRRNGEIPLQVVGIVRDAKYDSLRAPMAPVVFMPAVQESMSRFSARRNFVVHTAGDPLALVEPLRRSIGRVRTDVPMTEVKTQERLIEESLYQERLFAALLMVFGGFALLLAAIGLHGVTAYATTQRTPEIGIRMALGADSRQVLGMILRRALRPVIVGVLLGLPSAWAATRAIQSLLFGVSRLDPLTYAAVSMLLAGIALAAAFLPAWRGAHIDPMRALRAE